jgi:hypothetical protein
MFLDVSDPLATLAPILVAGNRHVWIVIDVYPSFRADLGDVCPGKVACIEYHAGFP